MTHAPNRTNLPPAKSAEEYERLLRAAAERLAQELNGHDCNIDLALGIRRKRWTVEEAMTEIRKHASTP